MDIMDPNSFGKNITQTFCALPDVPSKAGAPNSWATDRYQSVAW